MSIEEDIEDSSEEDTGGMQVAVLSGDTSDEDSAMDTEVDLNKVNWEEEPEAPTFANTTYTITGVVMDPRDIRGDGNGTIFRSTVTTDYTFFIIAADATSDIFTAVYITLDGTQGMNCYSDEYQGAVQSVIRDIEGHIKAQREQERYDSVLMVKNAC